MFSHSVRRKRLLTLRDTQYAPIHPSKQEKSWIIYLCSCVWEKWMRNMWQAVGWERDTTGLFNTNTRACWEITGECSFRDTNTVESVFPLLSVSALRSECAWEPPGRARGECWPPADLGSRSQFACPWSKSIKSQPTVSKPWQIFSFSIHFWTAVVPSNGGRVERWLGVCVCAWVREWGGWVDEAHSQYNVCRVSAHPGWQQHECLSQETSVLLSHSTAGQSIWRQRCMNSINSYLP